MFLTADELRELTCRTRSDAQRRALRAMGIEHRTRPNGSVAVLRSHVEHVLGLATGTSIRHCGEGETSSMKHAPWMDDGITPTDWLERNFSRFVFELNHVIDNAQPYVFGDGPNIVGIYFLINDDEVIYVGKSNAICRRLMQHRRAGRRFSHYWYFGDVPELFVEYVEAFYIHTLMPPLNEKYPLTHQVVSAAIKKINRAETA